MYDHLQHRTFFGALTSDVLALAAEAMLTEPAKRTHTTMINKRN